MEKQFTILITTKDRLDALVFTLEKTAAIRSRPDVDCIICDDGSHDGTSAHIRQAYPDIRLIRNENSLGLMASRNRLMAEVRTPFAISIDDDLHFVSPDPIERLAGFFETHPDAGVAGFRIFWSEAEPRDTQTRKVQSRMQSYPGGAHAFRMAAWQDIRPYPEWFRFYGEEDFASFQLFRKGWGIYFVPEVLVNHRVNIRKRKRHNDYVTRLRRALRSGWYLFFLFYPARIIPRRLAYSIWIQLRTKVFRGDFRALAALLLAGFDLLWRLPRLLRERDGFSQADFQAYTAQPPIELYWTEGQ